MTANAYMGGESSHATDDAATRRRTLIALCAAKAAGLDGASAQRYIRDVVKRLVLRPLPQASGTARPLKAGVRLYFLRDAWPGLLVLAAAAAAAISAPDFWIQSLFIAAIGLAIGVPLAFASVWNWREKIRTTWSTMLPDIAAPIHVDSECLTVGATSAPWSDVRLVAVELRYLWQPRINPIYRIDQLRLAMDRTLLVLDVCLIENGQEVLDTVCDKLV